MRVTMTVNGRREEVDVAWEGESLLYALRERLGLMGSKNACEQGECGSCSVYLDGVLVCACLVLAGQAEGSEIVTVEGLANGEDMGPLQNAFRKHHALQCGFCTPGILTTAHALLSAEPYADANRVREVLSGDICRCTGYLPIVEAILDARKAYGYEGRER